MMEAKKISRMERTRRKVYEDLEAKSWIEKLNIWSECFAPNHPSQFFFRLDAFALLCSDLRPAIVGPGDSSLHAFQKYYTSSHR